MVHTLFYSRFRPDIDHAAYTADVGRMKALAAQNPGFVSIKSFTAEDGERLTVVGFRTPEDQAAWRKHADHVAVQEKGRAQYYAYYRIVTAEESHAREWAWEDG